MQVRLVAVVIFHAFYTLDFMRNLVLATVITLVACGSTSVPPLDLSIAIEPDLALPADLAMPTDAAPSDFAFAQCASPSPGIYGETVQYTYELMAGAPPSFATSVSTVIVKNNGSYSRPSPVFASPDRYHCSFETVDATTCMAACCPGQASSPTMYFDSGGWTMWTSGACAFQTTTGAQFVANIVSVEGYFTR